MHRDAPLQAPSILMAPVNRLGTMSHCCKFFPHQPIPCHTIYNSAGQLQIALAHILAAFTGGCGASGWDPKAHMEKPKGLPPGAHFRAVYVGCALYKLR